MDVRDSYRAAASAALAALRDLPGIDFADVRVSREERRAVWLRYARFLIMGLTFQLAADIVETSISTSWETIGRLAAIAVIRTFLEFFLGRDVAEVRELQHAAREQAS